MTSWPGEDRRKNPIEATVVGATPGAKPIPAMVVGDRRDLFGRRLGYFAFVLLVIFFLVSNYVQSARNGRLLEQASGDRSDLINSLDQATETIEQQTLRIDELTEIVNRQNKLLEAAGIPIVVTPSNGPQPSPVTRESSMPGSSPPRSSRSPASSFQSPSPSPSPTPTSSSLVGNALEIVCDLTNRVCIIS